MLLVIMVSHADVIRAELYIYVYSYHSTERGLPRKIGMRIFKVDFMYWDKVDLLFDVYER